MRRGEGWACASALTPPDGAENRLVHRGIPVASATRLMSELGHKPAYLSPRRAGGMSAMPA